MNHANHPRRCHISDAGKEPGTFWARKWDVLDNGIAGRLVAVLASELRTTDSPARALRRLHARWHRENARPVLRAVSVGWLVGDVRTSPPPG